MAVLMELRNARKSYGGQVLLDEVSAGFDDTRKVGLIGRNGAGKSTLARILAGEEELDGGEVFRHKSLRFGMLRQHDPFEEDETVLGFLLRDSDCPDWRCGQVAGRFELKGPLLDAPIRTLSGGWQSRVKLAALLLHEPNLLVMDEPTNFLDLSTQMLLERFLRTFPGGCLVISHDRTFLGATCDHTLELSQGELTLYPGKVDAYLREKAERVELARRENSNILARRRQLQTFIDKNRAGANTASQARNKQKQLDRLELNAIDAPEASVGMRLPDVKARKGTALSCTHLTIGYPGREVASGIDLDLEHGGRVAVVGDNGQGKTTFLRTVTGSLDPKAGACRWGHGCELGVYAQHVYTSLPEHLSVRDYLASRAAPGVTGQAVLDTAGSFLFRGDAVEKPIRVLSGGERARLCLAGLFLKGHNVLVLDEPVNHLDVETTGELAEALARFAGTVIFTSHDRAFMGRVATQVVEVRDGRIRTYPGDYALYVRRMRERIESGDDGTPAPRRADKDAGADGDDAKARARERYRLEKEIASLERQIERRREPLATVEEKMLETTDWQALAELQREKEEIGAGLAALEEQWLTLHESMEELQA